MVAAGSASLVVAIGLTLGVGPALVGGVTDRTVNSLVNLFLALPMFPLLILLATLVEPSRAGVVVVIALIGWPDTARVLRSQTLSLRQRGYVSSSRALGAGLPYVLSHHLVPALGPYLVTGFVTWASVAVSLEAGLAFVGLGDPTEVSWGLMLNRALDQPGIYFTGLWTSWVLPPGCAVMLTVLGLTLIGVGLEPRMNPRLRRSR